MITLITAVPGSGKTLYSIGLIIEALNDSRPVYTNINGLIKDKFPNNTLLFDAPDDWRDTPAGSLVIYDECQQPHLYPANAQRGLVSDERLTAMETHRHTGHDLVFITQAPTFVHHHVRKLVGQHIHLYRARGIPAASKYEWSHVVEQPNDRREQERADFVLWKFPKEHFSFYTSAVFHTHKFKMPAKLAILFSFIFLGVAYVVYNLISNDGLAMFNNEVVSKPTPLPVQHALDLPNLSVDWTLTGYIRSYSGSSRSLAVVTNGKVYRLLDFASCGSNDNYLTVECLIDGKLVSFETSIKKGDL